MSTLRNLSADLDLSSTVVRARSPLDRILGLLRSAKIAPQQGLWLQPCSAIHTIGMRAAIDVILLNGQGNVVGLRPRVGPNQLWISHPRAKSIIEMGAGFLDTAPLALGDRLSLVDCPADQLGAAAPA